MTMHDLSVWLVCGIAQRCEGVEHQNILRVNPYLDRHTYAEAFCFAFLFRVLLDRLDL